MSKQHPIDRYVNLKAGDTFTATGTADRHWPTNDHLTMKLTGRCVAVDDSHVSIELTDESNGITASGSAAFLVEGSETHTNSDSGNTLHAKGKFGPLTFDFADDSVHYEEGKNQVLEATADGKLNVPGPIDMHIRVTVKFWKVGADTTRVRFVAVRKNGKPFGEGELSLQRGASGASVA